MTNNSTRSGFPSIFHSSYRSARTNQLIAKYGTEPGYIRHLMRHARFNGIAIVASCFTFAVMWTQSGYYHAKKNKFGGAEIEHYEHQLHFKHELKHGAHKDGEHH